MSCEICDNVCTIGFRCLSNLSYFLTISLKTQGAKIQNQFSELRGDAIEKILSLLERCFGAAAAHVAVEISVAVDSIAIDSSCWGLPRRHEVIRR
jgi:hypothetical protein